MTELLPPAAFVDAAWREGRLVFQRTAGGEAVWPPRIAAPGTGQPLGWDESAGLGTVYASTALHARDEPPRNLALIELDEGFRMMSRVEGLPAGEIPVGLRVRVRFSDPDPRSGARLPLFEPAGEAP
jgi:uncharacterized OB-fold protein